KGATGGWGRLCIGGGCPRWGGVHWAVASLEGNDQVPKKYRVQDLSMTAPTMKDSVRRVTERVAAHMKSRPGPKWLNGYSDQSVEQLLSLEGEYRTDSLVLAFEEAINQKAQREGMQSLTEEERIVLAVEALEREVNNGGDE